MADEQDRRGWRLRRDGLTATKRARFLEVLAETGSVQQATYAGMASISAFRRLRERDPAFDDAWKRALAQGYEAVEEGLLAVARGDGRGGFDPQLALAVLKRRDAAVGDAGYGRTTRVKHVPAVDIEKAIATRLEAIAKRLARS